MISRDCAALDDMHADRLLEEQAEVEKGHRKAAGPVGEQGVVVAVADFAPFLVIDLLPEPRAPDAAGGRRAHAPGRAPAT